MILEVSRGITSSAGISNVASTPSKSDFMAVIQDKVEKMQEKLDSGTVNDEVAVLTGGQYFTDREWNALIRGYDRVQDKFRELMRERHELQEAKRENAKEATVS